MAVYVLQFVTIAIGIDFSGGFARLFRPDIRHSIGHSDHEMDLPLRTVKAGLMGVFGQRMPNALTDACKCEGVFPVVVQGAVALKVIADDRHRLKLVALCCGIELLHVPWLAIADDIASGQCRMNALPRLLKRKALLLYLLWRDPVDKTGFGAQTAARRFDEKIINAVQAAIDQGEADDFIGRL